MALLDSPDCFLDVVRDPPPTRLYRHRTSRATLRLRAYADTVELTGRCARCGAEFRGRLDEEREWFAGHQCEM